MGTRPEIRLRILTLEVLPPLVWTERGDFGGIGEFRDKYRSASRWLFFINFRRFEDFNPAENSYHDIIIEQLLFPSWCLPVMLRA